MSKSAHRHPQPPRSPSPAPSSDEYSDEYSENQGVSVPPPPPRLLSPPARWGRVSAQPATRPILREPKHGVDQRADSTPSQAEGNLIAGISSSAYGATVVRGTSGWQVNAVPTARSNHRNRDQEILNHIHNPTRARHIVTALDSNNLPSVRRERNISDPTWVTGGSSTPTSGPPALSASGYATSSQTQRLRHADEQGRHIPIRVLDGRKQQYTIPEWERNRTRGWVESSRNVVAVGDTRMVEHWAQERAEELARQRDTRLADPRPHNLPQTSSASRESIRSQPETLQSRGRVFSPPRYKSKRISPVAASFGKRKRTVPPMPPITRPRREGGGDSELKTRPIAPPRKYRHWGEETSTSDAESVASSIDEPNTPLVPVRLESGYESDSEEQEVVSEGENEKLREVLMSLERDRAARRLVQTKEDKRRVKEKEKEKELSRPEDVFNSRYTPPGYLRSSMAPTGPAPSGSANHRQNVGSRMDPLRDRDYRIRNGNEGDTQYMQGNRQFTERESLPDYILEKNYQHPSFRESIRQHQTHRPPENMPSRHRAYTLASSTFSAEGQKQTQRYEDLPDNEYSGRRPGAQSSRISTESNHRDLQRSGGHLASGHSRSRSFPNEVSRFFDDHGFHRQTKRIFPTTASHGQPSNLNLSPLRNEYPNSELSSIAGSLHYTYTSSDSNSPSSRPSHSKRVRTQPLPVEKNPPLSRTAPRQQPPKRPRRVVPPVVLPQLSLDEQIAVRRAELARERQEKESLREGGSTIHPVLPTNNPSNINIQNEQEAKHPIPHLPTFPQAPVIQDEKPPTLSSATSQRLHSPVPASSVRSGGNGSMQNADSMWTESANTPPRENNYLNGTQIVLKPQRMGHNNEVSLQNFMVGLGAVGTRAGMSVYQDSVKRTFASLATKPSRQLKNHRSIGPVPEEGGMGIIKLNIIPQPAFPHIDEGSLVRGVLRSNGEVAKTRRRRPFTAKVTKDETDVNGVNPDEEEDQIDELDEYE